MTDLADAVALAEDTSFAVDWLKELIDNKACAAPIFDGERWTCTKNSTEGEEQ